MSEVKVLQVDSSWVPGENPFPTVSRLLAAAGDPLAAAGFQIGHSGLCLHLTRPCPTTLCVLVCPSLSLVRVLSLNAGPPLIQCDLQRPHFQTRPWSGWKGCGARCRTPRTELCRGSWLPLPSCVRLTAEDLRGPVPLTGPGSRGNEAIGVFVRPRCSWP